MRIMTGWLACLVGLLAGPLAGAGELPRIKVGGDGSRFVREGSGDSVVMWGFNYDRDDSGRLLEDYWADEWATVAEDFGEMKALGANVVRVHLQLGRFLKGPTTPDLDNLARLAKLVTLAESTGVYLDLTGLGCYHKKDVPAWYNALDEPARWAAQAAFWKAVAATCRNRPAVFCYDLMNEPILDGGDPKDKDDWLPGEGLAGKHYVQRIIKDRKGRTDPEVARAWVETLTGAIRSVDDRTLITVGEIPWAQVFKGAKPLFQSPEVGRSLDFASVHFYPKAGKLDDDLAALKAYEVGKPLVVEEFFPLHASFEEAEAFMVRAGPIVDGWIGFYWGKTIEENEKKGDIGGALVAGWLKRFRSLSPCTPKP